MTASRHGCCGNFGLLNGYRQSCIGEEREGMQRAKKISDYPLEITSDPGKQRTFPAG